MSDFPFRSHRSPRDDTAGSSSMNPATMSLVTPPRNGRMPQHQHQQHHQPQYQQASMSATDSRSNLPRRFTTESGRVPTLSNMSFTSPQRGPDPSQDYNNQSYNTLHLIEKKKMEYERIREQRRRFEIEMQKLDQEYRKEAQELALMEEEAARGGHQSEPTTPPEHNSGFPSMFSRPSRYSMSSLASPPGFYNRPARSGSQLISPPSGLTQGARYGWDSALPSRSVPTTRRNSDDEERDEAFRQDMASHRSAHAHRYSMPVSRSRNGAHESGLDGANVTRFLFDDEEGGSGSHQNAGDERFPTLVRRDDQILSASSAALDLALSSSPNPEPSFHSNWSSHINRHRNQQSLSAINGSSSNVNSESGTLGHRQGSLRHSLDLKYIAENGTETPGGNMSNMGGPPKLQSSYSSNDVPTVKNSSGQAGGNSNNANNHAQQHFHNHNASMGRIPAGAMSNRAGHSRELSSDNTNNANRDQPVAFQSIQSALQPSAAPFGPSTSGASSMQTPQVTSPSTQTPANFGAYYPPGAFVPGNSGNSTPNPASGGYGMNMITAGMQQMNMNGAQNGNNMGMNGMGNMNGMNPMGNVGNMNPMNNMGGMNGMNNMYPNQNYGGYGSMPYSQPQVAPPVRDSQARVIQGRRQVDNEVMSRYNNMPLESFTGQIYELCKDQHGCRYLQKKLEDHNPEQVHAIWLETYEHVIELMTDPFGNYLCQKLFEFCNDEERTKMIQNASQDMVRIALNTHGTRALQKMIEFVSTPQQIHTIIEALRWRVVELIQDLNGNHVIQKCLNKLTPTDAQFIFDAVGADAVGVGTHRHGCCVLQRCIDHASGDQKLWLIQRITDESRILVQDPFGNYVVQYIIDLNEPTFTEPIVGMFQGCISQLSRHKFSSNVIEKCLRCAQAISKDMIVEEMLHPQEMERLIRDSYGNYVVQTALDYATPHQKHRLVEAIRPVLPTIRNTPYGRRIQAKVSSYDTRGPASTSGQATPADATQGQIPLRTTNAHARNMSGSNAAIQPNALANGGGMNSQAPNVQPDQFHNGGVNQQAAENDQPSNNQAMHGQGMPNQPMDPNMSQYQNGNMAPGGMIPGGPVQQPQQFGGQGMQNSFSQGGNQSGSHAAQQGNGGSWM